MQETLTESSCFPNTILGSLGSLNSIQIPTLLYTPSYQTSYSLSALLINSYTCGQRIIKLSPNDYIEVEVTTNYMGLFWLFKAKTAIVSPITGTTTETLTFKVFSQTYYATPRPFSFDVKVAEDCLTVDV